MRVSGRVMRSRYLFARKRGDEVYENVLQALPEGSRDTAREGFLETRWYPFDLFIEFSETIDRVLGAGDMELCYEMGRFSCDQNLTTAHRLLFKFGNIGWLLDRASKAWDTQFDAGEMSVVKRDLNVEVIAQLDGVTTPKRAHCLGIKGWMVRAAEISGEENFRCDELCRASGDPVCQWQFRWL